MTLKYTLNEEDFLIHQLFVSSKNKSVSKARRKSLFLFIAAFLLIGWIFIDRNDLFMTYFLSGIAFLSLFFYPIYLRNHYKNHYRKFIIENYQNRFGKETDVRFESNFFTSSTESSETKINLNEIEEINEIKNHIFLKLKSGGSLIIAKSGVVNLVPFQIYLKSLSTELSFKYSVDLNWKWK